MDKDKKIKDKIEIDKTVKQKPAESERKEEEAEQEYIEKVVDISRVAKVVKGGKRFGFSTIVVVGDGKGSVGVAIGKSNDVRSSIEKGVLKAKENMTKVELAGDYTIPHTIVGKSGAGEVLMKPAGPGTGLIAGGPVRAVLTAVGVKNILTKCLRSRNPLNVVYATMNGLNRLRSKEYIAEIREKEVNKL
ncbi:30S ribosomal protein S5 [Elusimicrobiota bacterium]